LRSFSYSGCSAWFEDMRLIIVAGLLMGVSLAIQSAHGAHAKAGVDPAASAARVDVSAPWYIAMNAGHSARTRGTLAGYLRETDLILSS
jgi:hypothetical protein